MFDRDLSAALPHAAFALASSVLALGHASRTAVRAGMAAIEIWLPLGLSGAILFAGWRFQTLEPTREQGLRAAGLLLGGGLYGAGFVAFIQFLQSLNGVTFVYPYYTVAMAGFGGVAMATVIAHYYVGYTQRMAQVRSESARARRLQKQASVLNRTLRHNLRNELQVIDGWLDAAVGEAAVEPEEGYRVVREHIDDLHDASDRARLIERVLRTDELAAVDVAERVERAAETVDSGVTVDVATPPTAPAVAHPEVGSAIEEAFRNAAEHNDHATLTVTASVSLADGPDGDRVWRIDITDSGGGIPDVELEALRGSAEGPLEHGRGLGLYLIQTVVDQSGGDLSIRRDDLETPGTTVSMTFPAEDGQRAGGPRAASGTRGGNASGVVRSSPEQASLD